MVIKKKKIIKLVRLYVGIPGYMCTYTHIYYADPAGTACKRKQNKVRKHV
jgi:hypothetical protein